MQGALVRLAERALAVLPDAFVGPLAALVGTIAYLASGSARDAVLANLSVIAPGRGIAARSVFVEQARNYLEIFTLPRLREERLIGTIERRGWEHFEAAWARGRGVILASAHLGPVSLVGQLLVALEYPTALPVEVERSELQRAFNRARAAHGLQLLPTDTPVAVIRALRQGKIFALLGDRAVTGVGERVAFFGRDALVPSAHVVLALRTGTPIIPAFAARDRGRLVASFEPPLEVPNTGDRDADVREGMRRWVAVLERHIAAHPDQWTVFEPVWSTTDAKRAE